MPTGRKTSTLHWECSVEGIHRDVVKAAAALQIVAVTTLTILPNGLRGIKIYTPTQRSLLQSCCTLGASYIYELKQKQ